MEQIIKNVYVGADRDYDHVKDREDFSVLRCCKYGPGGHKDLLKYTTQAAPEGPTRYWVKKGRVMAMNLLDLDDPNKIPPEMIKAGLDFAKEELAKGQKVLIACNDGGSRGPTCALMFLRSLGDMTHPFMQSEKVFRTLDPKYDPAMGIRQFARDHWNLLNNTELTNVPSKTAA
jgi:hypothetical protein